MGAPTPIYVNQNLDADTGSGTLAAPYGRLQYALSDYTWDSSNGNLFRVAGTGVITTQLTDPNMFLSDAAPVYLEGWDGVTSDGEGWAVLDGGNGTASFFQYTNRMGLRRIRFRNGGTLTLGGSSFQYPNLYMDLECDDVASVTLAGGILTRSWIHGTRGSSGLIISLDSRVYDSFISDCTSSSYGIYANGGGCVDGCTIYNSGTAFGILIHNASRASVTDTSVLQPNGSTYGVGVTSGGFLARYNNLLLEGDGTGSAIRDGSANSEGTINNVSVYSWGSTSSLSGDLCPWVSIDALTESPFAKTGAIPTDFTATDFWEDLHAYFAPTAAVVSAGWRIRGAIQSAGGGGGSTIVIPRRSVRI